ncbi:MAG: AMP-binding protein, partial [Chloroflexi bacterium]|nr:AMP-binding protein [Chloroflexota bacterium]
MTIDIDRGEPFAPAVTIVELLRQRATTSPDQVAYIFQDDRSTVQISYGELDRRARSIAGWLQQGVDKPGPVLICCPSGLDYIAALFGCFYAGFPAIPSSPPESGRTHRTLARLQATIRNAQPVISLTTDAVLAAAADVLEQTPELQPLRWHTIEQIEAQPEHTWHAPALTGDTLAMLMYTSGSTGTPKGVMISHGNMLHNVAAFPGFDARPCRAIVSWLPLYHDLGLFLGVVHPLFRNVPAVLMSPADFVRRPLSWLEAMSRYGATTTGAPNFAYDLCVRKITPEQRATLDLSAWNMALNGAEPVRPDVLDRFTQTFAECGFRPETFYPSYGMSDATATVSGATTFAPPVMLAADREALKHRMLVPSQDSSARILVGCGQPLADQQLAIVDPDTLEPCAENGIGEIWLSGPSVAQGYWQQPETTAQIFHATLAGTSDTRFFRTGDLGFMHAGELFLVGRLNDLLIIRGQNFYPEDIEVTVGQSHAALPAGGGAVFAVEVTDEERVVVVHEVERPDLAGDEIMSRIRESVAEAHGIQVHAVALIRKGSLPRTSSGKIARKACRAAFVEQRLDLLASWGGHHEATSQNASKGAITRAEQKPSARTIADWLVSQLATLLKLPPADIDLRAPFKRHGLDSIQTLALTAELESWLGCRINQTLLWSYPSIAALSEHLAADHNTDSPVTQATNRLPQAGSPFGQEEVAIIGMGCRFPGAGNPAAFWQMLCAGVDAITEVPAERWDIESLYHADRSVPGKMYSRWGGFLDNLDSVDARFMGISPREAALLDPQQRLLFEVAWEALEDAGQVPADLSGSRTGVFVGALGFDYLRIIQTSLELIDAYTGTGAAHSILANRLSYMLNLCGPSITVDTACSGSLVAMHLACQSLRSGESELALAGGVNVNLLPDGNVFFSKAGALSPDGRCKPFSAEANGIVRSDGAGVVVLKRLSDAIRDNDPIYAVIRGSAVNQDGRTNGIMAPSAQSQEAVLRAAYRQSQVQPEQIQYIETHGTGTSLGDMIEAQALGAVLADNRPANRPCHIGSVKSNIGHTEAAAGMASVIKVALALKHGVIPPSLHCQSPNPQIAFDEMRLQVQQALTPWPSADGPRLAGVSGFGFGGTNAHVVLEGFAAITPQPAPTLEHPVVLPLSAHTDAALRQLAQDYRALLTANAGQSIQDLCYTA